MYTSHRSHWLILLLLQVWDLVVVGAGIAGSALAFSQGQVSGVDPIAISKALL